MEDLEKNAFETFADPPRFWKRYVDDTFLIIKKIKLVRVFHPCEHNTEVRATHYGTRKIRMSSGFGLIDQTLIKSPLLSAVCHKPTHLDRYLNVRSEHPIQQKKSVVSTLFERANNLSSTAQDLNSEMKYVKRTLMMNCYPKWMIQNKKKK